MILIVDYQAGNLTSVKRALDHLGLPSQISADPAELPRSDRIIFPGVGHAGTAMEVLKRTGLDEALRAAYAGGTPILGLCLGSQIVLSHSEEGDTPCLGLLPGHCPKFSLADPALKIPHMGWNALAITRPHYILKDVQPGDEFYFVHSYYPQPADPAACFATSDYELTFPAAIGRGNLFATQFHPEKSGRVGLSLLRNFADWDGAATRTE
jgi:imidazole glycerol-phosphate synthase subunit HisH